MEQPDYSPLLIPVMEVMLPVTLAMIMGTACMAGVALVLRRRFRRTVSLALGQAAGIVVLIACMWTGLSPLLGLKQPGRGIIAGARAMASGPFSQETRCRWYTEELGRIQRTGFSGGQAITLTQALRAKAGQDDCLSTPKDYYPSRSAVEGYLFRLKDDATCTWARNGFQLIAAESNPIQAISHAQAHWQKTQQAGCVRY